MSKLLLFLRQKCYDKYGEIRMELTMHVLRTEKLQVGMRLGENIYRHDQLVISEKVPLTTRHIEMIQRLDLLQVKIIDEQPVKKVNLPEYKEKYRLSVESFKRICYSVAIGDLQIYDEVKSCLDPVIEELERNPEMALKLWQIHTADYYTYEHSVKVSMLSVLLSKWMNKPSVFLDEIAKVGLLHDIGKCNIPNEILNKPDMLTEEEFGVMKTHATLGYVLLSSTKALSRNILKGILHHHERYDGTGYPAKQHGRHIPEYARIVSVVDVFDAMTSNRVYREKMNPFKVLDILRDGSQGALDPEISNLFVNKVKQSYLGSKVLLNTGMVGVIQDMNTSRPDRPIIKVNDEIIDLTYNYDLEITSLIN